MGQAASKTQPSRLHVHPLARDSALLVWDSDEAVHARHVQIGVDGGPHRRPRAACSLGLTTRHVRNLLLVAIDQADSGRTLAVSRPDGCVVAWSDRSQPLSTAFDAAGILTSVDRPGKARLLRFFLETCPAAAASIATEEHWVAACRGLIGAIAGVPGALSARCALVNGLCLYEGSVPLALCGRASAVLITDGGLKRPAAAHLSAEIVRGRRLLHLLVEDRTSERPAAAVVFAGNGAIIRMLPASTPPANAPSVLTFLRQRSAAGEARRHLLYAALAELSPVQPRAADLLRELRLLLPEAVVTRGAECSQPPAGIDHVIASDAGLFIRGWLAISRGFAEAIEVECGSELHRLPITGLLTFPLAGRASCVGFVASLVLENPEAPCRIRLSLSSGLTLDLSTGPDSLSAREARDRVLESVPASVTANRAIGVIESTVQALHLAAAPTPAPMSVATIGPLPLADPLVSVVLPLGRCAEPVRCRVARAAIARDSARCEFVYVLDRPNDFASAERLLSDLYHCCGVGGRLLLMPSASNPASPLSLGAAAARGRYLLFLNSGTVPETANWLEPLLSALAHLADAGAAAATVVHPDQSLHQLGGDIGEDTLGRWGPRWHAAGFPRAAIAEAEPLPALLALPGLMVAKTCFDRVGGFDPGYFDPRFRDADFSLRLREDGGRLALLRSSVFVEFDDADPAPSISSGTARELDRRRFERRWRALIEALRPSPHGRHVVGDLVCAPTQLATGGRRAA